MRLECPLCQSINLIRRQTSVSIAGTNKCPLITTFLRYVTRLLILRQLWHIGNHNHLVLEDHFFDLHSNDGC